MTSTKITQDEFDALAEEAESAIQAGEDGAEYFEKICSYLTLDEVRQVYAYAVALKAQAV